MPETSDSDASPMSPTSSSSTSGGGDDEEKTVNVGRVTPAAAGVDPNASDESGSSDGVLVELDQEAEDDDDGGREEMFEDASDNLAVVGGRSVGLGESMAVIEFGESSGRKIADELVKVQVRLEDAVAECRKYKEEREVFGREIVGLRRQLQDMVNQQSQLVTNSDEAQRVEERALSSPTPLHSMLGDCSKFICHLKGVLDEQENLEGTIQELNAVIHAKEEEITESSLSRDVIVSYLGSIQEMQSESSREISKRLLSSIGEVIGQENGSLDDANVDGISLVEEKMLLLLDKHRQLLLEIRQLGQDLAEIRADFIISGNNEPITVLCVAREELLESNRKQTSFHQKMNRLMEENRKIKESLDAANAEIRKTKMELEQAENKFLTTKEKLTMAVTKGKSLVQYRDSLKHSLAEKTNELQKCMLESEQKSKALQATEASAEELKVLLAEKSVELEKCLVELEQTYASLETIKASAMELNESRNIVNSLQELLSQKDNILQEIEKVISEANFPQEVFSSEAVDRIRWVISQKDIAEMIFIEHQKVRNSLCSVDLPETVSSDAIDYQVNWLVNSFKQAKTDNIKMQDEVAHMHLVVATHESELSRMHEEIDCLRVSLLEEKQEKDILQNEWAELKSTYENIAEKLFLVSSVKNELIKVPVKISEITLDGKPVMESNSMIEKCIEQIQKRIKISLAEQEQFERLQILLYTRDQELILCRMILEEEMVERSERIRLSGELQRISDEVTNLRNNKDSLQKELERVEEKSSLLREKLSMAVKKGKSLVQERESFKKSLNEKNSEIEKLIYELHKKDSALVDFKGQIEHLSALPKHIQNLESDIVSLRDQREQIEEILEVKNLEIEKLKVELQLKDSTLQNFKEEIDSLSAHPKHIQKLELEIVSLQDQREKIEGMLDAKNSEIEKLKYELQLKDSALQDIKEEIEHLSVHPKHIQELKSEIVSLRDHRERIEGILDTKKSEIEKLKYELQLKDSALVDFKEETKHLSDLPKTIQKLESKVVSLQEQREQIEGMLDANNSEIEKLKFEVQSKDSALTDLKEEIECLSTHSKHIQDLESEIVSLRNQREQIEGMLDVRNSDIQKLKYDLQLKDSTLIDLKKELNNLLTHPKHIQKLELEIVSLRDQREQMEVMLEHSKYLLKTLIESIGKIVLPIDNIFERPIDKAHAGKEKLHKVNEEAPLHASRKSDALITIQSLENEVSRAKEHIYLIAEEKKEMQLGKASIEQELQKIKEEASISARKLADAYVTIESLEDALSQEKRNFSLLDAEKYEAEAKHKQQITILNAKLAECMEELAVSRSSLGSQSAELHNNLKHLKILVMDDSLLSLLTEEFRKKINSLRNIGLLMQSMHEHLSANHTHPGLEVPDLMKILSIPNYENFIKDKMVHRKARMLNLDDFPSFTNLVEEINERDKSLGDHFNDLSSYMDDHIALLSQALQATRNEFFHILELQESLKLNVDRLEADKKVQVAKQVSLQKDLTALLSACTDAIQEIQTEFHFFSDLDSALEDDIMSTSIIESKTEHVVSGTKEEDPGEYIKAAESLLSSARRLKMLSGKLADVKEGWRASMNDLKHKLKKAELTAETAYRDQHLNEERASLLEKDLATLQEISSEMKIKIENYQAGEDILHAREEELFSLQHILTANDRGKVDAQYLGKKLEELIHKVNELNIPFTELLGQGVPYSSPIDKLFYIVDIVNELQHRMDALTNEKADMQLIIASYISEIEHLKETSENIDSNYQELESKRTELLELTVGLERAIQRLGGKDSFAGQKTTTSKTLLSLLERLIIASSTESENFKSRIQELGAKLQAREKFADELSTKLKVLEDSYHARLVQPETAKERTLFESTSAAVGSEISEIEDLGAVGKSSISPASATHVRTTRKGSDDHLILNIDPESDRLIAAQETDAKGHVFKSLNTSGLIPKEGKFIADRVDSIWVSGGRMLMSRPRTRLGLIAYWLVLHLWLLSTIL
ncbi:trans-Golgi network-localized SYP41-interacting protein 1-like [Typha angustifolia]|uniref:trans-Golgi network-localized SYP41-interacting protein 1-like n=1 Tax=Typha angustifolia TaxID=59011 RepID=UPI003C2FF760